MCVPIIANKGKNSDPKVGLEAVECMYGLFRGFRIKKGLE